MNTKLTLGILFTTSLIALAGVVLALVLVVRAPDPQTATCAELKVQLDSVEQQMMLAQRYVWKHGGMGGP
jgi:hypothetical protein